MKIHSKALSLNNVSNSSSLKSSIFDFNNSMASSLEYVKSSGRREINSFSNSKRSFSWQECPFEDVNQSSPASI